MTKTLILAEQNEGKIKKTTFELVSKAVELGGEVDVVAIGDASNAGDVGGCGAKKIFVITHPNLKNYSSEGYVKVLADLINEQKPDVFMGTASPLGKDLFPRLAARLHTGLAPDCINFKIEGGKVVATRPIYAGKALVDIKIPESTPQMFTARPNSFPVPAPSDNKAEVVKMEKDPGELRAVVREVVKGSSTRVDLTEADRIVSGGRAMKAPENFKLLEELADVLGASVGASRAAVDAGMAPVDIQVGQTGKVVNPSLYMAFGISGAIQHLAGMRTSKVIVAVNKDPEAPIFQKADYGIVNDLFKVVPLLTEELKKVLTE